MNTSKMKAATMIACYGASKQRIARIIGTRRAVKLLKTLSAPYVDRLDYRRRIYYKRSVCVSPIMAVPYGQDNACFFFS